MNYTVLAWSGSMYPAHDDVYSARYYGINDPKWARSKAGEERKREREVPFAHVCARWCLLSGLHRITQLFAANATGDASPTRIILRCIKEGTRALLFFNYVLLRPSGRCSRESFSESSRNCLATHLFLSALLKRERERRGWRGERTTSDISDC